MFRWGGTGLAVVLGLALAPVARADPAFDTSYAAWLQGDEAAALPALAELAKGGNGPARLLLALIDSTPALQGDWLSGLTRAERLALLRAPQEGPGSISGRVWFRVQAASDPVAAAWVRLRETSATVRVILDFAELGEPRAARIAAMALARRERHGFADAAADPVYPPSALAFAIREGAADITLLAGDPQREVLGQAVTDAAALSDWLGAHPEGAPVVALCEILCPLEAPVICRPAAYAALGGYWRLMAQGAPVEALTPSETFHRSLKGLEVLRRQMSDAPTASACLDAARNQ